MKSEAVHEERNTTQKIINQVSINRKLLHQENLSDDTVFKFDTITMLASRFIASSFKIATRIPIPPFVQATHQLPYYYTRRSKSTMAVTDDDSAEEYQKQSTAKNLFPDFNDARIAYESKSTKELLRAALCFQSCKVPSLVDNAENLVRIFRNLFGGYIADAALKATLYGHFCVGEDQERIRPVIQKLRDSGVGSILDYAAENDGTMESCGNRSKFKTTDSPTVTAREYDYESEAQCDQHVSTFLQCINDVAASSTEGEHHGYAAIKVTALGNPKLLARLSKAIVEAKRLFSVLDLNGDGLISREEFESGYNRLFVDGDVRIKEIFEEFDPLETGFIDYITWSMMLSPQNLPKIVRGYQTDGSLSELCLTNEEIELLNAMYNRGRKLGKEAAKSGVRLLIDAEQVRYQPAIDNLVLELQRRFNVDDKPIIYNTYQCYLRDAPERLRTDVARSERFRYHFGAKLVRGAYMESERELAASLNLRDLIHPTIEKTHECYDNSVDYLLRHSTESNLNVEVMCATHNQASIVNAINSMDSYGIDRRASTACFAQLYGMSDQLTFNLGKHGYQSYKYMPYGKVDEVMPYLLRRARENSAIVGGATIELGMIKAELGRRFRMF
uniref:Proline dehydrogenase n=1 Tax=Pseudo-nitzschia australis TaxID=44445 RepID=A0A7S4EIW5_9STRA|mmetsp:Transcript_23345/g.51075  ORF Transcript_23345/g.51075 Transcript_23345/m.51075 type:complete len:616 (-) Transcript_23345:264-2111(-)